MLVTYCDTAVFLALVGGRHHGQVLDDFLCVLCLSSSRLTPERHECGDFPSQAGPSWSSLLLPEWETEASPGRGINWLHAGAHMFGSKFVHICLEVRGQPQVSCTFKKKKKKKRRKRKQNQTQQTAPTRLELIH